MGRKHGVKAVIARNTVKPITRAGRGDQAEARTGGCVSRFAPDGSHDKAMALPASQITNVTFAGRDLDRMFVTSAAQGVVETLGGALFEISPGICGLPTYGFGA